MHPPGFGLEQAGGQGAARAGRPAGEVTIGAFVRISIDDQDPERARRALGKQCLHYALIPAYRAHFERMGFAVTVEPAA